MKVALFSDLHIYPHFAMNIFEDIAEKFLYDLLAYCKSNSISKIIFLGDWFHLKNKIQVPSYLKSYEILKLYKNEGIEIVFLIGNHDSPLADTNDFSILHSFSDYGNVVPLYDWEDVDDIRFHYLSYTKELPIFEMGPKSNILFGHLDVNNFLMDGAFTCTNGFEEERFSDFDYVFSGHFHKHQVRGNIIYVGGPYQQKYSDRFDSKGFIVLDTQTKGWNFITYSAPEFKEINADMDDEKLIKGNFLRVHIPDKSDEAIEIKNKLLALGANDVQFIYDNSEEKTELNIIEDLTMGSMRELAVSYYDAVVEGKSMPDEIQQYLDSGEDTKETVLAMFDEIEHAYLTGWKPKEDE